MATTTMGKSHKQENLQRIYWAIAIAVVLALIVFYAVRAPRVASDATISNSVNSTLDIERTNRTNTNAVGTDVQNPDMERREIINETTIERPEKTEVR